MMVKNNFKLFFIIIFITFNVNAQYCTPNNINVYDSWTYHISNVNIGTINNSSSGAQGSCYPQGQTLLT